MWSKHCLFTVILSFASFYTIVESATRHYARTSVARSNARSRTTTEAPHIPTPRTTLNTGGLSDTIMDAFRPTINGNTPGVSAPRNNNNRGNPNGRQQQPTQSEPAEVNLTASDIRRKYPWIENPQAVVDSTNTSSSSGPAPPPARRAGPQASSNGAPGPTAVPTTKGYDGWTRFNNPNFLRDQLEGLYRDDYDFTVAQGAKTRDGIYKVKILQNWRGLPIYDNALTFKQENDANMILESADGEYWSGIEDDITTIIPALSPTEAVDRAVAYNYDQGKPVQNAKASLMIDTIGNKAVLVYSINYFVPGNDLPQDPTLTRPPPPQRPPPPPRTTTETPLSTFYRPQSRQQRQLRRECRRKSTEAARVQCLADLSTTTTTSSPPSVQDPTSPIKLANHGFKRPWLLMNANSGEIYQAWDGLTGLIKPGNVPIRTGNPIYGIQEYTERMYKDDVSNSCYYQKPIGGGNFLRVNDKTSSNTANVYKFRCSDGNQANYDFTNGAPSPRNSAFKWGSEAVKFLKRTSNSRWNFNINIETHHSGFWAVWNGNEVQLGDGDAVYLYPLTTPDTVTHEVTHAFTEQNSNLEYQHQSGAINEAYSDMAAVAFMDYFFNYPRNLVYKLGRTAVKRNISIRDLCNPGSNGLLFYDHTKPIIASALHYNVQTGVHNASALYSKAFCELSKTPGWSIQQAFKVFTIANTVYWKQRESFHSGACGVKKAAWDLKNTLQAATDVDNAFQIVDIACNQLNWLNLARA